MLERADGVRLLYAGKIHWIIGSPESAKTWLVLIVVADALMDGFSVLYLDLERDEYVIVSRLRALGVTDEAIRERLAYIRPRTTLEDGDIGRVLAAAAAYEPRLAVIDACGAAMGMEGLNPNDGRDFHAWWGGYPSALREAITGPLVVVDHVTKDPNTRNGSPTGSYQKMATTDVAIGCTVRDRFAVGMTGRIALELEKDTPGRLWPHAAGKALGTLILVSDPSTEQIRFVIEPPEGTETPFRPTHLMERLSREMERQDEPRSKSWAKKAVTGNERALMSAWDVLVTEGFLVSAGNAHGARVFRSDRPYREADDPLANTADGGAKWCPRSAGHRFSSSKTGNEEESVPNQDGTASEPSLCRSVHASVSMADDGEHLVRNICGATWTPGEEPPLAAEEE